MNKLTYLTDSIQQPLFNIKEYEYFKPIELLSEHFIKPNFYQELLKSLKNQPKKDILPSNENNDIVIQEYVKCISSICFIILYPKAVSKLQQLKDTHNLLEQNGSIYYIKNLKITFQYAYNLLYILYAQTYRMKENNQIIYKLERLGFTPENKEEQEIQVIIYNHKNKEKPINGSSAIFKSELRKLFLDIDIKTTKISSDSDKYPREYDYIHVNDTFNEAIDYAPLFLNKNTIKFMNRAQLWRTMNFIDGIKLFKKFKNFITELPQLEQSKFIIAHSAVLFTYGVRNMNDIDGTVMENVNITTEQKKKIMTYFFDMKIKPEEDIDTAWSFQFWNDKAKLIGAKDFNEMACNPKYYYYFMGIKFIKLKYEIILRSARSRPAQLTDLLVINKMFNLSYKIEIPEKIKHFNREKQETEITIINSKDYKKTMQHYLKTRYYIDLTIDQLEEWLKSTEKNIKKFNVITGGSLDLNISNDNIVFLSPDELVKLNKNPIYTIYSDDKPYLYEGEDWGIKETNFCFRKLSKIHNKKGLRVFFYDVHNFVTRCNQGIAPIFGEPLNIFQKGRNIDKFLELFKTIDADIISLQNIFPISKEDINKDLTSFTQIKKLNFEYLNKRMKELGYEYCIISQTLNNKSFDYRPIFNAIYSKIKFISENIKDNVIGVEIEYKTRLWILNNYNDKFNYDNMIITGKNIKKFSNTLNIVMSTNFHTNQMDDKIVYKSETIKPIYSLIITSNLSDHFGILSDFI
jgi:hypothetical protein